MECFSKPKTLASIILTLGLVSCGGGDSDSSDDDGSSTLAELSPETSSLMAKNASEALAGCTFNAGQARSRVSSSRNIPAELLGKVTRQLNAAKFNVLKSTILSANNLSARSVNESVQGTCPTSPGNYTIIGTHEDGVDDTEMTFNDFCFGTTDEYSVIDGKIELKQVGEPSPTGPIPKYLELSTNSSGLEITEKSSEGTFTHSVKVDDLKQTFGNGNDDPTASKPNTLTADAIILVDGRENNEFNVSGVDLSTYTSGNNDVSTISSLTFKDPDSGTVNISSTPLTIDEEGVLKSGSITATGANGSSMVISPDSSGKNSFKVMVGNEQIGLMNCDELDADNPFF